MTQTPTEALPTAYPTAAFPPPFPPAGPPSPPASPAQPDQRHGTRRVAELATVAVLAAGLASGGTYAVTRTSTAAVSSAGITQSQNANPAPAANPVAPVIQADGSAPDWAATAKAVSPSVVAIKVTSAQAEGEGSGVILDKAGHIITNNHVATGAGSAATITVTLDDGRTYPATIAGTDPSTDLAVLTLTAPPADLVPISIGDSDALTVGQPVMAVGNPLGLAGTVTTGIVSALNRPVSTGSDSTSRGGDPVVTNAIQTSAAINPGNSGGALVTANGQLVGINSSIASLGSSGGQSGNIGIGFAIPVAEAKAIADQLVATGSAKHAYLGVSSTDGTVADGGAQRAAAVLRTVAPGTPAATAGLRSGDAVVAIGGERVDSSLALVASIRERRVGDTVSLTVVREGQRQQIDVTLVARPAA
jgi:putative serine protease PepD